MSVVHFLTLKACYNKIFIVCMDTDGRLCDQMESETFSQSDDKPGSGFLPQVAHLYVKLANLLVMFERCLIINNR